MMSKVRKPATSMAFMTTNGASVAPRGRAPAVNGKSSTARPLRA